jgi:hypothetical protein
MTAYGAGDPVDQSDPSGQCAGPGGECFPEPLPCTTTSCSLNIATAGRVHEPYLWKDICGPGSLAVMLKFAIGDSKLQTYHAAKGTKIWGYASSEKASTKKLWTSNAYSGYPDGPYTDFMMWIATQVMTHPAGNGTGKSLATVASMTALIKKVGVGSYKYKNWSAKNTEKKMEYDVEHTIRSGIPAIVGTLMHKLPSQAAFSNDTSAHWVSVVAFDPNYYYYIDTCWGVEQCGDLRSSPYDPYDQYGNPRPPGSDPLLTKFQAAAGDNPLSLTYRYTYPGTWRITKEDMWTAMQAYKAGGGWWSK